MKPVNEALRAEARAAVAEMPRLTTEQLDALRDLLRQGKPASPARREVPRGSA